MSATSQIELSEQGGAVRSQPSRWNLQTALDSVERLLVLAFYVYLVWRLVPKGDGSPWLINALLLVSEGLVLVLFLIRRPTTAISMRRSDWLLALAGALFPLLVSPGNSNALAPAVVCFAVMVCGMLVQVHAKLSLGRSMGLVAANRGIRRSGPYQFLRHPMYAGYMLTHLAFWLFNPTEWNLLIYSTAATIQVLRLLAEERFLRRSDEYRAYMENVRFRLIPGVF